MKTLKLGEMRRVCAYKLVCVCVYLHPSIPPPSCRWATLGWPHKISEQVEYCSEQLNQDEERFQKNMLADQATFEDRLDTLQVGSG